MKITREFVRDGKTVAVTAEFLEGDRWRVRIGDTVYEYEAKALGDGGVKLQSLGEGADRAFVAYGASLAKGYMVRVDGRTWTLEAPAARRGGGAAGGDGVVRAPMTGTVLEVACKPGDVVEARQTLVVVSAMKMEHKLTAGVAGVVRKVTAQKGGTVDQGAELVVVEPQKVEPNKSAETKS
ncbi:MAG: biotin/lipoyl-containing protein [Planctomycetota bacterium]|jgi:biotin carboxyl carrier protein